MMMVRLGLLLAALGMMALGCGASKVAIYTPEGFSGRLSAELGGENLVTFEADDSQSCGSLRSGVKGLTLIQSDPKDIKLTLSETPGEGLRFERELTLEIDGVGYVKGPSSTVSFEQTGERFHGTIFGAMVSPGGDEVTLAVEYNVPPCQ